MSALPATSAAPSPASAMRCHPLRFAGYAALFYRPDGAGDILLPGAFRDSLAAQNECLPLLWQHRREVQIGRCELAREDGRGLRIIAQLFDPASRYASALRRRDVNGLSFGFRPRIAEQRGKNRMLVAVDIIEVSLVSHPLQHGARVHLMSG